MKRLFALLLLTAASTFAITGCGGDDLSDIPEVDPAEQAALDEEQEAGMEAAMQEQAGGN
ncbi:MAG: hypothetical protein GY903_30255 [Fuerstiella sp.]|nr:hypothetical protein [Fuerstiella sp.]MCP4858777.1 hypothetical protein [Fuerstiella sp.]